MDENKRYGEIIKQDSIRCRSVNNSNQLIFVYAETFNPFHSKLNNLDDFAD